MIRAPEFDMSLRLNTRLSRDDVAFDWDKVSTPRSVI